MTNYTAKDGDRLDEIVYQNYGSLQPMDLVLIENSDLLSTTHLYAGDTVYLPDWEPPKAKTEAKRLWK